MVTVVELRDGLEVRLEEHEIDDDVGRLLDRERAPLQSWLAAAHALLGRGDGPGFVRLLEEASEGRRPGSTFDRIQVLCCLAAYFVHQAVGERDRKVQSDLTTRASKLVYDALQLDLGEQLPHLVLGQMSLAKVGPRGHRMRPPRLGMLAPAGPRVHCNCGHPASAAGTPANNRATSRPPGPSL